MYNDQYETYNARWKDGKSRNHITNSAGKENRQSTRRYPSEHIHSKSRRAIHHRTGWQMTTATDVMPFARTIGGGFFIGLLAGYAIKKIIKIAAVIIGLFIAALAYLEYRQRESSSNLEMYKTWRSTFFWKSGCQHRHRQCRICWRWLSPSKSRWYSGKFWLWKNWYNFKIFVWKNSRSPKTEGRRYSLCKYWFPPREPTTHFSLTNVNAHACNL